MWTAKIIRVFENRSRNFALLILTGYTAASQTPIFEQLHSRQRSGRSWRAPFPFRSPLTKLRYVARRRPPTTPAHPAPPSRAPPQGRKWDVTDDLLGDGTAATIPEFLPRWRTTATLRERIAELEGDLKRSGADKRELRRRGGAAIALFLRDRWARSWRLCYSGSRGGGTVVDPPLPPSVCASFTAGCKSGSRT